MWNRSSRWLVPSLILVACGCSGSSGGNGANTNPVPPGEDGGLLPDGGGIPNSGYVGPRLRQHGVSDSAGAFKVSIGIRDEVRGEECEPARDVDGNLRCFPKNALRAHVYFTDAACKTPAVIDKSGCDTGAHTYVYVEPHPEACDQSAFGRRRSYHRLLADASPPVVYDKVDGTCQPIPAFHGPSRLRLLGDALPATDFARLNGKRVPTGTRLDAYEVSGDEGFSTRATNAFFDTALAVDCVAVEEFRTSVKCIPVVPHFERQTAYSDSYCQTSDLHRSVLVVRNPDSDPFAVGPQCVTKRTLVSNTGFYAYYDAATAQDPYVLEYTSVAACHKMPTATRVAVEYVDTPKDDVAAVEAVEETLGDYKLTGKLVIGGKVIQALSFSSPSFAITHVPSGKACATFPGSYSLSCLSKDDTTFLSRATYKTNTDCGGDPVSRLASPYSPLHAGLVDNHLCGGKAEAMPVTLSEASKEALYLPSWDGACWPNSNMTVYDEKNLKPATGLAAFKEVFE